MARRRYRSNGFDERDLRDVEAAVNGFKRLDRRVQGAVIALLLVGGLIAAAIYYREQHRQPSAAAGGTNPPTSTPASIVSTRNMLLGNPSGASADPANRNNYLMVKPYFALSYNEVNGTPNWVSWRVSRADLGDSPRKQLFDPDSALPPGFKIVTSRDYSGSGFDRGHMCPHSDRSADTDMSYATFVMTNIIPQAPNVNQKAWNQLEDYCRDLVRRRNDHLHIIAGPLGRGGRGSLGPRETIGAGKVTVPAECWKLIVIVPDSGGDDDLSKITAATRVLTVIMPNDNDAVGEAWAQYRTSPAEVEQRTGYHFFDRLSPDIAAALRQKVDTERLPAPRNLRRGGGGGE
jgi:endonuclease G, mitochondrial